MKPVSDPIRLSIFLEKLSDEGRYMIVRQFIESKKLTGPLNFEELMSFVVESRGKEDTKSMITLLLPLLKEKGTPAELKKIYPRVRSPHNVFQELERFDLMKKPVPFEGFMSFLEVADPKDYEDLFLSFYPASQKLTSDQLAALMKRFNESSRFIVTGFVEEMGEQGRIQTGMTSDMIVTVLDPLDFKARGKIADEMVPFMAKGQPIESLIPVLEGIQKDGDKRDFTIRCVKAGVVRIAALNELNVLSSVLGSNNLKKVIKKLD